MTDRLEMLDGRNILNDDYVHVVPRLMVYDSLLPNGLADPLGMELLEL